jgi:hypothetical protein
MDGVGIEKFAEYCHTVAEAYVDELTDGRCNCTKVEVFEHESNSAIFEKQSSEHTGAEFMNNKADEIKRSVEEEAEDIATTVDNKQDFKNVTRPFKNSRPAPVGQKPVKNTWTSDSTALGL